MSGATDSGMVKTMGVVMGCLAVFALVSVLAARVLGTGPDDSDDPMKRNALLQRIQPIGAVRTSADDLETPAVVTAMAEGSAKTGAELVNGACAACHASGVAGAPKLDDTAEWAKRRELGLDALVASVTNGKGSMPPGGGSGYSEDEILRAVQHIAHFEVDDSAAAPAAEEPASTQTASTEEVSTENTAADAGDAADAADAAVAALVVGQVPDGLTDNVKSTVDGICAGCHLAGVAGAPKYGDTAAWQERADKGLAALTSSVINGIGVMPPKGASTLTDEEIPMAIQYLMSK